MNSKMAAIDEMERRAQMILADLVPLVGLECVATDPDFVSLLDAALEHAKSSVAKAKTELRLRAVSPSNGGKTSAS